MGKAAHQKNSKKNKGREAAGAATSSSGDGTKSNTKKKSNGGAAEKSAFPPNLLMHKTKKNQYQQDFQLEILVPSAVFVARNFMNAKECQSWIQYAEDELGFEEMSNPQTREYAHRECGRISRTDWDMADLLYQRMTPIIDEMVHQHINITHADTTYAPRTCNGNLRLYRYGKNMSFGRHFDGSEKIAKYKGGNTEITVLVYLSSCQGGATRFYLPAENKKKKRNKNEGEGIYFVPETGAVLLHIHGDRCLEHEADPVLDGVKYVLRTDIVYAPAQS